MSGLEKYDPRLITAWEKGATEQIRIPLPKRSMATQLRQKLYRLRKELEKEQHPAYNSAKRAAVRIIEADSTGTYYVIIEPADAAYDAALEAAGLSMPELPEIDL
jgi:hypothetical protein